MRLLLGEPLLRGLLDRERAKAAFGGTPAAWSCSIVVECGARRLLLGELMLRVGFLDGEGKEAAFAGCSRCAELLDGELEAAVASAGAPAAWGCPIER